MPPLPYEADAGASQSPDFALGEWNVIPSRNLISREAEQVRLEPRVMDVLVCLAQRAVTDDRPAAVLDAIAEIAALRRAALR